MSGTSNPAFAKFNERNFAIVAELNNVVNELGRSMAQVAINWLANRPGVATVLVGATKQIQLDDNLHALDFYIPHELVARLDVASARAASYPYFFFGSAMQTWVAGADPVSDKPAGYTQRNLISSEPAGAGGPTS